MAAVFSPATGANASKVRRRFFRSRPLVATCLIVGLIAFGGGVERHVLWPVVGACIADYRATGASFPCLAVDLSGGVDRGAVVLRPPIGPPDTILSPTRKVVGIEDPWLQSPAAPNYFAAALRARWLVSGPKGQAPRMGDIALAANSRFARTQDQLHIHIGCAAPRIRRALRLAAGSLKVGEWTQFGPLAADATLWAMPTGQSDLAQIEPFRLAAQRFAGEDLGRLTIAVVGTRGTDRDELTLLVAEDAGSADGPQFSAEDVVDSRCRTSDGSAAEQRPEPRQPLAASTGPAAAQGL